MLYLDHTSMTIQYLVMNIFQTPGSCWIQWWNPIINSNRWKTWSLASIKLFPIPFPFPPLSVSINRTLSPCILCYQNDILGTQHLLATKKREEPEFRQHFNHHDAQIQNQKAGPHGLHAQTEIEEKIGCQFWCLPWVLPFKFKKKNLRNKHSICFLELQLLKIEINRTLSQSYVFNTNPRLCPDNFSCCKNKSTRVMTKHHWIPIAPSVLKLANIANLLGD